MSVPLPAVSEALRGKECSATCHVERLEGRVLLAGEVVTQFLLINADTDMAIGPLVNGAVINLQALPTRRLNVVAETAGPTQSVRFALDANQNFRTENTAPYALAGDDNGNFKSWTPALGSRVMRGTPFPADNAGGTAGTALQISFQVIDQPVGDPVALQASVSSIAFGTVLVGQFAEASITLTNPQPQGGSSVTVNTTTISGAFFSDEFADSAVTLAPGQSLSFDVRFTPGSEGSASGTLNISHTGTNNPLAIGLTGSGLATNHAPVLAAIGNKSLAAGTSLNVPISATDSDGDSIDLNASGLPAWASLTDNGNGTGTLVLSPPAGTSGNFNGLVITATDDGSPALSDSETINISVSSSGLSVNGFTLINADTDQPIGQLTEGSVINFALIGTDNLNVRADASGGVASIRFGLDANNNYRTENSSPFALGGDSNGNYKPWTPSLGSHTLRGTGFSGSNASGSSGATLVVNFTVVDGPTLTANPTAVQVSVAQGGAIGSAQVTIGSNDGNSNAAYAATSNALWLTVSPGGTLNNPLILTANTTDLPLGTHKAFVSVTSATHGAVKIPVTLTVTGVFVADQIHLSFVQNPATTLTVVWRTMNTSTPSIVEYRAAGASNWIAVTGAQRSAGTTGKLHEVTLTNLVPDTSYEYRVRGDGGGFSPVRTTRTMPALGPADLSVIYFADTGLIGRLDGLDTGTAQAIDAIKDLSPDLLLSGGDYAYFNTDTRFGTLENTIDAWFNQNQPLFGRIPIMPTYGNHEVLLGESYSAWANRFATPEGWNGRRNYSFDIGDAHFVSIMAVPDSGSLSSASIDWIENDLAAAQAAGRKWIIPYFHVSPFSDGSSHPSNTSLRAQFGPLFEQYGVKVAIASHDQSFERTYPLTNVPSNITITSTSLTEYDQSDGVVWMKVSPAGKLSNRNNVNDFSHFQSNPPPFWTAVRDDTMHHFARLLFSAQGTLRVETYGFIGDGTAPIIIDSFEFTLPSAAMRSVASDVEQGWSHGATGWWSSLSMWDDAIAGSASLFEQLDESGESLLTH